METESRGYERVRVYKSGSSDIAVSVLLNTSAGTALGKCTHRTENKIIHTVKYVCVITAGSDYTALNPEPRVVSFSPSRSSYSTYVYITIINDNIHEDREQFTVWLSLPSGSTGVVLGRDSVTVEIRDEDRECLEMECFLSTTDCVFVPPFQE